MPKCPRSTRRLMRWRNEMTTMKSEAGRTGGWRAMRETRRSPAISWEHAMMNRMNAVIRSEDGQGMTEYIIIVALIGIAAIAVITFFGQNLRALFAAAGDAIGGEEANANVSASGGGRSGVKVE